MAIDEGLLLAHQVHQAFLWRRELPQLDARLLEDLGGFIVHVIAVAVHHFRDANLDNLDRTRQARTSIAV